MVKPTIDYLLIGLFVLSGIATFVWLVFWLAGSGRLPAEREVDMVFRHSVHGLTRGTVVQFMGVQVGTVESVRLLPGDPPLVHVRAFVEEDTPVGPGTRASVEAELITGIALIRLDHRPDEPAVYHQVDPGVEEIATRPDTFRGTLDQLPDLVAEATELLGRAQRLLSDDNLTRMEETLAAVETVASAVAERRAQIDRALLGAADAMGHVQGSAEAFEELLQDLRPALESTARSAEQVAEDLRTWLERHQEPLEAFVEGGLGRTGEVMEALQRALGELERLGRRLGEDPSRAIFREAEDAIELPP
jgi:phospholipid/cholesterol/gamma-HCH transport system substrate-binding protein